MKCIAFAVLILLTTGACLGQTVKVAPVTVEPIHMTIDVTVHDQRDVAKPAATPGASPSR
jgi:hypothetical protein